MSDARPVDAQLFDVRVVALREEAPGVVSCELRTTGAELPIPQ